MHKHAGAGVLANVKFAVFGLGDSAYAQFNVVARKLHAIATAWGCHNAS